MPSTEVALSFGRFWHLSGETRARAWDEFMSLEGSDKSRLVGVDTMDRNLLGKKERFNPESNTWAWANRDELRANVLKMLRRPGTNYHPRVGWHVRQPSVLYHVSREARAHACRRFHTSLLHNGEVELQNAAVRFNPEVDNLSQNFKFVVKPKSPSTLASGIPTLRRPLIHGWSPNPDNQAFHSILPVVFTAPTPRKYPYGDSLCLELCGTKIIWSLKTTGGCS